MPAAELSRHQAQISAISTQFLQPKRFLRSLFTLLDLYADQNFRPGQHSRVEHLMPVYRLPEVVMGRIGKSLSQLTLQNPIPALTIMDELKQDKHFEAQFLAAGMLGFLPPDFKQQVWEHLQTWIRPEEDEMLIEAILRSAQHFFTAHDLESWLKQIQRWLETGDIRFKKIGLRGLKMLVEDVRFDQFEKTFALLTPFFLHPVLSLQRDTLEVTKSFINRSEMETSAFMLSILQRTEDAASLRLIRRAISLFSTDVQERLHKAIPVF
jgi:hypothetical protein